MAEAVRNSGSVAAIATLITLIYLAVQIRESSQVSRLSLQENFVSGHEKFFHSLLAYRYHVMYQARTLEPLEYDRSLIQIDRFAAMHSFRSWWPRQRSSFAFDPEFVQIVDDRIRKN